MVFVPTYKKLRNHSPKWLCRFVLRQQQMRITAAQHPHSHLPSSIVFLLAILGTRVASYCGFNGHFSGDNGVRHAFMCLLLICIPSSLKYLLKFFRFKYIALLLLPRVLWSLGPSPASDACLHRFAPSLRLFHCLNFL